MNTTYEYRPRLYFCLTFLITYLLWFAGAYVSFDDRGGLYMLLMLPGLMAPFLISAVMIFTSGRRELKEDFINRLINPRLIDLRMLPLLVLMLPLVVLISIAVSLPFGGSVAQFQLAEGFSFSTGFVPVLLLLLMAATFEELGWRGYAFDSLASRYDLFSASLIFSILWSLWHFPLVFVKDSYQFEIISQNIWFGVNFFISIIPLGVIISWFCIRNRKSVMAAILFHFIVNISQEMFSMTQTTKCIETVVLMFLAGAIILIEKDLFFSKGHLVDCRD